MSTKLEIDAVHLLQACAHAVGETLLVECEDQLLKVTLYLISISQIDREIFRLHRSGENTIDVRPCQ